MYGWSNEESMDIDQIAKVSLTNYKWQVLEVNKKNDYLKIPRDSYGFACLDDQVYMLGGYSAYGIRNSLVMFNLSSSPLEYLVVSPDYLSPSPRMKHSFVPINSKFFLFGGYDQGKPLGDFWQFNVESETWTEIVNEGIKPSPRFDFAAYSTGDLMFVYGGENGVRKLSDLYQYSALTNSWKEVEPRTQVIPSARSGACVSFKSPAILIYGGETENGPTDQLWKFDLGKGAYELLSEKEDTGPGAVSFHSCEIEEVDDSIRFYVMMGKTTGEEPLGSVYYFDFKSLTWEKVYDKGYTSARNRAKASVTKIGKQVLVAGGERWGIYPSKSVFALDTESGNFTDFKELPDYSYSGASAYYKTSLYVHGSGGSISGIMRQEVPKTSFIKVDFSSECAEGSTCAWKCSPGTYFSSGECKPCRPGTYSSVHGADSCLPCRSGTYNQHKGASSTEQCYPCNQGTYNDLPGSTDCKLCPFGFYCPVGSSRPVAENIEPEYQSEQPKFFEYRAKEAASIAFSVQLSAGLLVLVVLALFLLVNKLRGVISKLDIFSDKHNHNIGSEMYLKRTKLGGYFSILFLLLALVLISMSLIYYSIDNIIENKALVPLITLEEEVDEFEAFVLIKASFDNYGGSCVMQDKCHPETTVRTHKIEGTKSVNCQMLENVCEISVEYKEAVVNTGAVVEVTLAESLSYSSSITVNITSFSSIPDETSSVNQAVFPDQNQVIRGPEPTIFYFMATPSVRSK